MTQSNFLVDDDGRVVTAYAKAAITAGDIVYSTGGTTAAWGSTVSESVLGGGYAWNAIEVSAVKTGTAAQADLLIGVALHDAGAASQVAVATEGLFLSKMSGTTNITAGNTLIPGYETTYAGVQPCAAGSTGWKAGNKALCGRALTGATDQGDYILWKLRI